MPSQGERAFSLGAARSPTQAMLVAIDDHRAIYGGEPIALLMYCRQIAWRRRLDQCQPRVRRNKDLLPYSAGTSIAFITYVNYY